MHSLDIIIRRNEEAMKQAGRPPTPPSPWEIVRWLRKKGFTDFATKLAAEIEKKEKS